MVSHLRTLDKATLVEKCGRLSRSRMAQVLWLFAQMYDQPAHAAVARFRDRSAPGRPFQHRLAAVVADYLRAGPQGVFRYLLDLEEVYLCAAAQVASRLGTSDALAALRFVASAAPEGSCRDQCRELADKTAHALETLTPPFWRGFT